MNNKGKLFPNIKIFLNLNYSYCRAAGLMGLLGFWGTGLLGSWATGLLGCWAVGLLCCWPIVLSKSLDRRMEVDITQTSCRLSGRWNNYCMGIVADY